MGKKSTKGKGGGTLPPPAAHQFKPGQSGNPKGRPKGSVTLNKELRKAVNKFRVGDKSYIEALLLASLKHPAVACKIVDKLWTDVTPKQEGVHVHNHNSVTNEHSTDPRALEDPETRELAARLEERLGLSAPDAGGNRKGSQ